MIFSSSSIFITILISSLLILLFDFLLFNKKLAYFLRVDILIILSFMIILRLLIPLEWDSFTITISFPLIMNPISRFLRYQFTDNFTGLNLLVTIWIIGIIFKSIKLIIELYKISNIYNTLNLSSKKMHVADFLDIDDKYNYSILLDESIPYPMVLGFKKIILVPKFNDKDIDIEYILLHEIEHLKNKDNWIKLILNIVTIIYWWFIPIYWLNKKITLVLEMRADKSATKKLNNKEVLNYSETLLNVQKYLSNQKNKDMFQVSSNFSLKNDFSTLKFRLSYLFNNNYVKNTNPILLITIILLPLLAYSVVFEARFDPPNADSYYTIEDFQDCIMIRHKDGTYSLYLDGDIIKFESLPPEFENLAIIDE